MKWLKRISLRWYGCAKRMSNNKVDRMAMRVYHNSVVGTWGRGRTPIIGGSVGAVHKNRWGSQGDGRGQKCL